PDSPTAIETRLTWDKALAKIEKLVQDTNAEAERVDRDTLVHSVEHSGEIEVGGQPERGEPEAPDAQPTDRLRVGAAGQAVRTPPPPVILVEQRGGHRAGQLAVEHRLYGDVVMHELAPYLRPEQPVQLGEELLLVTGEEPAIDLGGRDLGHDVDLVA